MNVEKNAKIKLIEIVVLHNPHSPLKNPTLILVYSTESIYLSISVHVSRLFVVFGMHEKWWTKKDKQKSEKKKLKWHRVNLLDRNH